MPDKEHNTQSDFMIETIKKRPLNRGKLLRRTLITALLAVIFGLIACVTILVLEPVISKWLYPPEKPQIVVFPEDSEEMLPEEMLAENLPEESSEEEESSEGIPLEEEQIEEILSRVVLDKDNYKELYTAMSDYVAEMSQYIVTVTAVTSEMDWFMNIEEKQNQTSGLIIADNGKELLIMTDAVPLRAAEALSVRFSNGITAGATIKKMDSFVDIAVLAIDFSNLPVTMQKEDMKYPTLGSSNKSKMLGMPVIAMGAPMGVSNSVGYGIVTTANTVYSVPDRNYRIIHTDIIGNENANGVLFNLDGEVIGIITNKKSNYDNKNVIFAYGMTEMRKTLEKLSNGIPFGYLGITGVNVPVEVSSQYGVPIGAYVKSVDMDSPAMHEGIQQGDVITSINDRTISTFSEYTNIVLQLMPGNSVNLTVMRRSQEGYKEMKFSLETGEVKE